MMIKNSTEESPRHELPESMSPINRYLNALNKKLVTIERMLSKQKEVIEKHENLKDLNNFYKDMIFALDEQKQEFE
jgi:GTP1/Obg family GTP-binding protein